MHRGLLNVNPSLTPRLARIRADQAAHPRKWIVLPDNVHGLLVTTLRYQGNIRGNVNSGRAIKLARSGGFSFEAPFVVTAVSPYQPPRPVGR